MQIGIFAAFLLALSVNAQYFTPIPCQSDEICASLLDPSQDFKCINLICMCLNSTYYQPCSQRDIIVKAKQRGLMRNCTVDDDCGHIEGARCYTERQGDGEPRRLCDCHPQLVMSADKHRCLPIATEPRAMCSESSQCAAGLDGAECGEEGRCRCRLNFHYAASIRRCILNRVYGDDCKREEESCYQLADANGVNALGCSENNVCKCRKNYVYVDGLCQYSDASRIVYRIYLVILMVTFTFKMV